MAGNEWILTRIWVSEIMLQQTQVKTVEAYYGRFIGRFPSVTDLAQAAPDEVMKSWEGLGYYSRARHLHQAAREVVDRFDGRIPDTPEELISLPGIGRYTAGAILSIAFGKPAGRTRRECDPRAVQDVPYHGRRPEDLHSEDALVPFGKPPTETAHPGLQPGVDGIGRADMPGQESRLFGLPGIKDVRSQPAVHSARAARQITAEARAPL